MGLKGGDSNPLVCGRLIKTDPGRIYFSCTSPFSGSRYSRGIGSWEAVYLKGCSYNGTAIIIPEAGKYVFTLRLGIKDGSFNNLLAYFDVPDQWGGVDGGWTYYLGSHRVANVGTCFINWQSIGNIYYNLPAAIEPRIIIENSGHGGENVGCWVNPIIDQPRAPVIEWFRISKNIGERSGAAWYWN